MFKMKLVAEISGKVSGIHFREGSRVRAGQLLLEIDEQGGDVVSGLDHDGVVLHCSSIP